MSIQKQLDEMNTLHENLLNYLEDEEEMDFQKLVLIFNDQNLKTDQHKLRLILRLILSISNNHHRPTNFLDKIEQVLNFFKEEIKRYYTNLEIFTFFECNKRLLLFLFKEGIITMDINIAKALVSNYKYKAAHYIEYFAPELKPFINEPIIRSHLSSNLIEEISKEPPELFEKNRKIGENDNYICELIRNDSVIEFISKYNMNLFNLSDYIYTTTYETNPFLIQNVSSSLIEYAAFYGSIQIIRYLIMNGVNLTESIWIYAMHGNNPDLIHYLEENNIDHSIQQCYEEAIKCHHNNIANYIQDDPNENFFIQILKSYNFQFMHRFTYDNDCFPYLCQFDYYSLVTALLKEFNVPINVTGISIKLIFNSILK